MSKLIVIGGNRTNERAVAGIHGREELSLGIDDDNGVERAEWLLVMQRP